MLHCDVRHIYEALLQFLIQGLYLPALPDNALFGEFTDDLPGVGKINSGLKEFESVAQFYNLRFLRIQANMELIAYRSNTR